MPKVRLDALLAQRGLFPTRSRAAASVLAGEIRLGGDGRRADKPGQLVAADVDVALTPAARYASRGGVKLANALRATGVAVAGRRCLDVGASTGGFTDCLLQHGAATVAAVDAAYGELAWGLRNDLRVTVIERRNARHLQAGDLPFEPDLVVVDVSLISVAKVLTPVLECAAPRFDCLALCKPQFEVGRERVGKGGVVRDLDARRAALAGVAQAGAGLGASVMGFASSGLPGPKGNRETFVWLAEGGRGGLSDPAAAAWEFAA